MFGGTRRQVADQRKPPSHQWESQALRGLSTAASCIYIFASRSPIALTLTNYTRQSEPRSPIGGYS